MECVGYEVTSRTALIKDLAIWKRIEGYLESAEFPHATVWFSIL